MADLIRVDVFNSAEHIIIGDKQRDTIIQTKGRIKIQYGNKLVDLFSYGSLSGTSTSYSKEEVDDLIQKLKEELLSNQA